MVSLTLREYPQDQALQLIEQGRFTAEEKQLMQADVLGKAKTR
jgi:hypothetical protein